MNLTPPPASTSTEQIILSPDEFLRDVSTIESDPADYHPSIGPLPLSAGQSACLTIWAPTANPANHAAEIAAIDTSTRHSSFMTLSPDAMGIGKPLLPESWCKLAGAHPDGAYATRLAQILGGLDLASGGGRPRSWWTEEGLKSEFGVKRVPACTQGRVVDRPEVVAIP